MSFKDVVEPSKVLPKNEFIKAIQIRDEGRPKPPEVDSLVEKTGTEEKKDILGRNKVTRHSEYSLNKTAVGLGTAALSMYCFRKAVTYPELNVNEKLPVVEVQSKTKIDYQAAPLNPSECLKGDEGFTSLALRSFACKL